MKAPLTLFQRRLRFHFRCHVAIGAAIAKEGAVAREAGMPVDPKPLDAAVFGRGATNQITERTALGQRPLVLAPVRLREGRADKLVPPLTHGEIGTVAVVVLKIR